MTAILATQALVFQDGGLLALGANVFNMAIAGVLVGYLPYALLRGRKAGVFLGGMFSLLTSAGLALAELIRSGVPMPRAVLGVSIGLFAISAIIEGAITVAVVEALERIQPGFLRRPQGLQGRGAVGSWRGGGRVRRSGCVRCIHAASDGIERLTLSHVAAAKPVAGLIVLALVYLVCAGSQPRAGAGRRLVAAGATGALEPAR